MAPVETSEKVAAKSVKLLVPNDLLGCSCQFETYEGGDSKCCGTASIHESHNYLVTSIESLKNPGTQVVRGTGYNQSEKVAGNQLRSSWLAMDFWLASASDFCVASDMLF